VIFTLVGNYGLLRLLAVDADIMRLDEQNRALGREIESYKLDVHTAKNSRYSLEKAAREQLGLYREGEVVYIFQDAEQSK